MKSGDRKWALGWIAFVVLLAIGAWLLLLMPWHHAGGSTSLLTGVVEFISVLVTAGVSVIGFTITRQSNRRLSQETQQAEHRLKQEHGDQERRLRLDAATLRVFLIRARDVGPLRSGRGCTGLLVVNMVRAWGG